MKLYNGDNWIDPSNIVKGQGKPTLPVVDNGVYVDTLTGDHYVGVNRGQAPLTNMSTNPRFKSVTTNLGTSAMANTATFKAVTLNLTYQTVESGSSPE